MLTVTISIGNSDDRLPQKEWSEYVREVRDCVNEVAEEVHLDGGSNYDSPRQNACFVLTIQEYMYADLQKYVTDIRKKFSQDSVAITAGKVKFI